VEGGGRSNVTTKQRVLSLIYSVFFFLVHLAKKVKLAELTFSKLSCGQLLDQLIFFLSSLALVSLPSSSQPLFSGFISTEWQYLSMNKDNAHVSIISFLLHNTEAQTKGEKELHKVQNTMK
jgi:hypothetical protein